MGVRVGPRGESAQAQGEGQEPIEWPSVNLPFGQSIQP